VLPFPRLGRLRFIADTATLQALRCRFRGSAKTQGIDVLICGRVAASVGARRSPAQRRRRLRDGFVSTRVLDIAWKVIGAPLCELLGRFDGI